MTAPDTVPDPDALLAAARGGCRDAIGQLLEAYRPLLRELARRGLAADLRAKGDESDLVQETFADAHRDFPAFAGRGPDDLAAWLRRILADNTVTFARHFRHTRKRAVGRVSLPKLRGQ